MAASEESEKGNRLASKFGMGVSADEFALGQGDGEHSKVYYSLHMTSETRFDLGLGSELGFSLRFKMS